MEKIPKAWRLRDGQKFHYVCTINDDGKSLIVSKSWSISGQRWVYDVCDAEHQMRIICQFGDMVWQK